VTDLVQNPTLPVRLHRDASRAAALARAVEMLELVGIPNPARCAQSYPHQLSGGMRQLAVIAPAKQHRRRTDSLIRLGIRRLLAPIG
jgi:ABC-type dipeptide/oligopeptide/nickel transport system ATPase component